MQSDRWTCFFCAHGVVVFDTSSDFFMIWSMQEKKKLSQELR